MTSYESTFLTVTAKSGVVVSVGEKYFVKLFFIIFF